MCSSDLGHAAAQIIEHVRHGDARAPDAGLAAADPRVNGDAFAVIHVEKLGFPPFRVKERAGLRREEFHPAPSRERRGGLVGGGNESREGSEGEQAGTLLPAFASFASFARNLLLPRSRGDFVLRGEEGGVWADAGERGC